MKLQVRQVPLIILLLIGELTGHTQTNSRIQNASKWISDKGYWVVEGNIYNPTNHIIYFYTNNNLLVYKEEINNVRLNLRRKKTLKRLKCALEQSIAIWEQKPVLHQNEKLIAALFK